MKAQRTVLFYLQKWSANQASNGIAEGFINLPGSLKGAELEVSPLVLSPETNSIEELVAAAKSVKPLLVFITPQDYAVSQGWVDQIRGICPVVGMWCDPEIFSDGVEGTRKGSDLLIVPSQPDFSNKMFKNRDKVLPLWPPYDPAYCFATDTKFCTRKYPVLFAGRRWQGRPGIISKIESFGVKIECLYRSPERTVSDYSESLRNAKIAINFCRANSFTQLKCRILEATACGAMLLEEEDSPASKLFVPMKEYVTFASPEEAAQKIRYYASHPEEAEKIAKEGRQRTITDYCPKRFWTKIFDALKIRSDAG